MKFKKNPNAKHSQNCNHTLRTTLFPGGRDIGWSVFFNVSWLKSSFHDGRLEWGVLGVKGLVITSPLFALPCEHPAL